jgi:hypothetical protein
MLNSAVIDVAIGLAFIFLLVSLLVTAASEAAAGWLKWRSTHLWEGVGQLLQSPDARTLLYNHPLVKGLARVGVGPVDWGPKGQAGPSYIPARTFALAVVDLLRRPHRSAAALEDGLRRAIDPSVDPATLIGAVEAVLRHAETDDAPPRVQWAVRQLRARVLPAVDPAVIAPLTTDIARTEAMRTEIRAFLADAPRRWLEAARQDLPATVDALAPMLYQAGGDVDRFRENIETWFDDGMQRVSGWYKRHVMVRQAIIAFLLAAALNIDAIQITQTLWREPTLRQSLAASAVADVGPAPVDSFALREKRLLGLGLPIGWECPLDAVGGSESGVTIGGPAWCSTPAVGSGRRWTSLDWLGIDTSTGFQGGVLAQRAYMLLLMVFGWSLTAAAASLGAPFWFDTLKRVSSIRAAGKSPEEHAAERKTP